MAKQIPENNDVNAPHVFREIPGIACRCRRCGENREHALHLAQTEGADPQEEEFASSDKLAVQLGHLFKEHSQNDRIEISRALLFETIIALKSATHENLQAKNSRPSKTEDFFYRIADRWQTEALALRAKLSLIKNLMLDKRYPKALEELDAALATAPGVAPASALGPASRDPGASVRYQEDGGVTVALEGYPRTPESIAQLESFPRNKK